MAKVRLQTRDKEIFTLDRATLKESLFIKRELENCEKRNRKRPINLRHVTSSALEKVLRWCVHHKEDSPQPDDVRYDLWVKVEYKERSQGRRRNRRRAGCRPMTWMKHKKKWSRVLISPWDSQFLNVDSDTLLEILQAAIFLDIFRLAEMALKAVAVIFSFRRDEECRSNLLLAKYYLAHFYY